MFRNGLLHRSCVFTKLKGVNIEPDWCTIVDNPNKKKLAILGLRHFSLK
jgi:hypothetical protein